MTGFYATEIALLYDRHMLKAAVPEIHVRKAAEAKEFYSDKLGFACANSWRHTSTTLMHSMRSSWPKAFKTSVR
jgi:hypothetical protein